MTEVGISAVRHLGRVRALTDSDRCLHIELRNGNLNTATTSADWLEFETGDVVYIDYDTSSIERAPRSLWKEETWVGVVRQRKRKSALVQSNSGIKKVRHRHKKLEVGYTVEVNDVDMIVRVLDKKPIAYKVDLAEDVVDLRLYKPQVTSTLDFDDFGGSSEIVRRARELIEIPLRHHDLLLKIKAKPVKGVLFAGPSGTGKTHLARILASQAGATFYLVNGPDILSKYFSDSMRILRAIFDDARKQDRALIFFDEIDSIAGHRTSDSHEESRRVVAQLLTLMDGFSLGSNLIVVAATNLPEAVDAALLRPGRFDWQLNFQSPDSAGRCDILRVSASRLSIDPDLPHAYIAARTENWTGAELAGILGEAALLAAADNRDKILTEDYLEGFRRTSQMREEKQSHRPLQAST